MGERKLATVRKIRDIQPIPNADAIECAFIGGWKVVVAKKDNFKVGDRVVYIEVDSVLPERSEFEFLRPRKFRIKTIKLRKQVSQGLVMPMSILSKDANKYKGEQDVTDELKIKLYEAPGGSKSKDSIPLPTGKFKMYMMRFKWFRKYWYKHTKPVIFPGWIKGTSQIRIQNMFRDYPKMAKMKWTATEKLDGQSSTFYIDSHDKVGLCSRKIGIAPKSSNNWTFIYNKYDLSFVVRLIKQETKAQTVVIQGEICGPGIQGNKYKLEEKELFIYAVKVDSKIYDYEAMKKVAADYDLGVVPLVHSGITLPDDMVDTVEMSKGISKILKRRREGLVFKSGDLSFKVINPAFLLKDEE